MNYLQRYRQASRPIKLFAVTFATLMVMLVVTTVWAYVRLYTARTNIPEAQLHRYDSNRSP